MKTSIVYLMVLSLTLVSCKQSAKESQKATDSHSVQQEIGSDLHLDNDWVNEIALDNGSKWEANVETTMGVAAMTKLIAEAKTSTKEDYNKLGNGLNDLKNIIVKECTMTGASHDNLHVFLHPLIDKIELLQNAATADEGAKIKANITEHLQGYYSYFD